MNRNQDPVIRAFVVAVLVEYGPMSIPELAVALDLHVEKVRLAVRLSREVVRVGGLGGGSSPYIYGIREVVRCPVSSGRSTKRTPSSR